MFETSGVKNLEMSAPNLSKGRYRRKQSALLFHYIFSTIPNVKKLLDYWECEASLCPNHELRKQALASIHSKSFHCQGGSVFAAPYGKWEPVLIELIVAYQTLCDYLDNLCDRAYCTDGQAFGQLHQSLLDALTPGGEKHDYYRVFPHKDDGGYIDKLVEECRQCLVRLPSYNMVQDQAVWLAQIYTQLQVYKHIDLNTRETALINWAQSCLEAYPQLLWQEFAAASGSTLALFALFGLATSSRLHSDTGQVVTQVYFPWICGLHILLDYLIDQAEDRAGGDLNFTFYYPDQDFMLERLHLFITQALQKAYAMPDPSFTKTVVEGLLAMYLSDAKVKNQGLEPIARQLIKAAGGGTAATFQLCKMVRRRYKNF